MRLVPIIFSFYSCLFYSDYKRKFSIFVASHTPWVSSSVSIVPPGFIPNMTRVQVNGGIKVVSGWFLINTWWCYNC